MYDTALRHPWTLLHLEHALYFAAGCLFWWPVAQDEPHALDDGARALYLFAAFLFASSLGLLLALVPSPVYDFYEEGSPGGSRCSPTSRSRASRWPPSRRSCSSWPSRIS